MKPVIIKKLMVTGFFEVWNRTSVSRTTFFYSECSELFISVGKYATTIFRNNNC